LNSFKQPFCFETPLKPGELGKFEKKFETFLKLFKETQDSFLKDFKIDKIKGLKEYEEALKIIKTFKDTEVEQEKQKKKLIEKLENSAKFGHLEAQLLLIEIYYTSFGSESFSIDVDFDKAIFYLKLASLMNEDVGCLSKYSGFVEDKEILVYLCKAASKGFAPAMFSIGLYFSEKEMFEEALIWYNCGLSRGHAASSLEIGLLYEKGRGMEQNLEIAENYKKLAKEWDPNVSSIEELIKNIGKDFPMNPDLEVGFVDLLKFLIPLILAILLIYYFVNNIKN
jgi:tetratricopeptide (TPR) repeat protein